jgi:hypothetical protein
MHPSQWLGHMNGVERRSVCGEQLLPLWTWLLEGYLPVAHIVADLDELEALESTEPGDAPTVRHWPLDAQLAHKKAA